MAELRNNPDSDYYKSVQEWFGTRYKPTVPESLIWVFFVIIGALIIVTSFAITLNYTVQQKTRDLLAKNAELQAAKEKAEESDRLKTVFLQNMSHEIRTPMNGILGFLELLREPELDDETKSAYVGIMNESGHRLMETINNIVEISKIESNQVRVNHDVVDINQCLENHYEAFKYQAESKGLNLNLHMGIGAHRSVAVADKYILNVVFANLLGNAVKFTRKGSVDFGASIDGDQVVCFVRDTGPGIASDRQQAIFERFVQEHVATTRPYEGSGLGLAIVKAYLDMIDGRVWVESEPGVGSTFWFSFPYVASHIEPVRPEIEPHIRLVDREMTILVAEDDDVSYRFLTELLKSDKVQILRASNGFEAVQLVREHPNLSLVLMDIKMPEMDGLEATRRIRSFNVEVPIVAQTAYALEGDRELALDIGCNEYITKPIDIDRLLDIVNLFARGSSD